MPKTTRYIGTCAACEGRWKVRDGMLVHHGYQRPGWGEIVGDCVGVGWQPHETSPALAEFLVQMSQDNIERVSGLLRKLPSATSIRVQVRGRRRIEWQEIRKVEVPDYQWRRVYEGRQRDLEAELRYWEREHERSQRWAATWQPQPLLEVEEEQAQKRAAKSEREAAQLAKWQAQAEKKVAYYQKCMDSALAKLEKAQNPDQAWEAADAIGSLYEDAAYKVWETMHDRITLTEAEAMLGFAEVWRALGLPPPAGKRGDRHRIVEDWEKPYRERRYEWLHSPERYAKPRPKRFVTDRPTRKNIFATRSVSHPGYFSVSIAAGPTNLIGSVEGLIDTGSWLVPAAAEALNAEIEADPDAGHWAIPVE